MAMEHKQPPLTDSDRAKAFIVSSVLTSYPEKTFLPLLADLFESEEVWTECQSAEPEAWAAIVAHLEQAFENDSCLDDLRSSYIDIFDRGREANPPYETEYGRERAMMKATQLADIAGFYKAFGFLPTAKDGVRDMLDHASVELEFYSLLLMKHSYLEERADPEGAAIVRDAQFKFLGEHLGTFISTIGSRPGVVSSSFYKAVYAWASALVRNEAGRLGVTPRTASWIAGQEPGEISCCPAEKITSKAAT